VSSEDELWQGYTEWGEPVTERGVTKLETRRDGALHGCSHLWVWRVHDGIVEVLLQQRAKDKPTWPGFYDISAAGHLSFGETPLEAILRETKEEIGLRIRPEQLKLLFLHRAFLIDEISQYKENEFRWVYGLQLSDDSILRLSDDEVEGITWVSLDELKQLAAHSGGDKELLPQGQDYFTSLFTGIERLLPDEDQL
jgi:isopentenyldiphosphate isomerase